MSKKTLYVLSDTHGNQSFDMLLAATKDADLYVHLGDHTRDCDVLRSLTDKPVYGVKGNNDYGDAYPLEDIISVGGVRLLLLHGHTVGVKYSMDRLVYKALEHEVGCVLYGHTHAPDITLENGIFLVNPGAFGSFRPTYARITVENGTLLPDIFVFK